MNYPKTKFDFLKNNFLTKFLIDFYVKAWIQIFRQNGSLNLNYSWKRRSHKLRALNRHSITKSLANNAKFKSKAKDFLVKNFRNYRDTSWSVLYSSLNEIYDYRYIPEDIYYDIVEKSLNDIQLVQAYNDKNVYERILKDVKIPKTAFRVINGRFYSKDYELIDINVVKSICKPDELLILKPAIESGGGKDVKLDSFKNIVDYLENFIKGSKSTKGINFIIQFLLEQHEQIASFHPSSVNTFRIMTLRLGDKIIPVSSYLRMGRDGSKVDNVSSGGISCGINNEGILNKYAYDIYYKKLETHPTTNKRFSGEKIPMFLKALELTKNLHQQLFYFDLVSWDIAIGKEGSPYMIELNLFFQECNDHQVHNGPLFKEYTDAVIKRLNI